VWNASDTIGQCLPRAGECATMPNRTE